MARRKTPIVDRAKGNMMRTQHRLTVRASAGKIFLPKIELMILIQVLWTPGHIALWSLITQLIVKTTIHPALGPHVYALQLSCLLKAQYKTQQQHVHPT